MFNVQDPTQRGPFFSYMGSFISAEQAYIAKRHQFFDAIGFTFPSRIGAVVGDPQVQPVAHITDAVPAIFTMTMHPSTVASTLPALPVTSWWQRFTGRHG